MLNQYSSLSNQFEEIRAKYVDNRLSRIISYPVNLRAEVAMLDNDFSNPTLPPRPMDPLGNFIWEASDNRIIASTKTEAQTAELTA